MYMTKRIAWMSAWVSSAVVGGVMLASPGMAQLNQSDVTGTNVFESPALDFFDIEGLDPALADRAAELSQEILDANQTCLDDRAAIASGPRRFALNPPDSPNANTIPSCQRVRQLLDEARSLIAEAESQIEAVNQAVEERSW